MENYLITVWKKRVVIGNGSHSHRLHRLYDIETWIIRCWCINAHQRLMRQRHMNKCGCWLTDEKWKLMGKGHVPWKPKRNEVCNFLLLLLFPKEFPLKVYVIDSDGSPLVRKNQIEVSFPCELGNFNQNSNHECMSFFAKS